MESAAHTTPTASVPARPRRARKLRILAAVATAIAAGVAVVFATIGDGVDQTAPGVPGLVLAYGHTATWVLLAAAFALTALDVGPRKLPGWIGYAALACYGAFLLTLWTTAS